MNNNKLALSLLVQALITGPSLALAKDGPGPGPEFIWTSYGQVHQLVHNERQVTVTLAPVEGTDDEYSLSFAEGRYVMCQGLSKCKRLARKKAQDEVDVSYFTDDLAVSLARHEIRDSPQSAPSQVAESKSETWISLNNSRNGNGGVFRLAMSQHQKLLRMSKQKLGPKYPPNPEPRPESSALRRINTLVKVPPDSLAYVATPYISALPASTRANYLSLMEARIWPKREAPPSPDDRDYSLDAATNGLRSVLIAYPPTLGGD